MKIWLLALFCLCIGVAFGQLTTEKRIEIESKDGYSKETVYTFGSHGFVMIAKSDKIVENGEFKWRIDRYNTDMILSETIDFNVPKDFYLQETFQNENKIYWLFKNRIGAVSILSLDAADFIHQSIETVLPPKTLIREMVILDQFAYLTATMGGLPFVLAINLVTAEQNFMPVKIGAYSQKKLIIKSMQLLEESKEIFVFVEAVISRKESETYIIRMSNRGEIKDTFNFSANIKKHITDATASYIDKDTYVITGTYMSGRGGLSEGLYFSIVSNHVIEHINFYNFLDLKNFLNFLPEKQQAKIEGKKARKESSGKDFSIRYYLATHNIIQVDDGYIFLAEAYMPTYRTESYTTTSYVNGQMVTRTNYRTVFDGYLYTHGLFAKYNKMGELQWDQTFEMKNSYKPMYVKRFIRIAEQNQSEIKLVFASLNRITSKTFDFDGNVTSEVIVDEIETGFDGDKTKRSFSDIQFWYDKYFLAYGNQTIKNTEGDQKRKRSVYFLNKLGFQ